MRLKRADPVIESRRGAWTSNFGGNVNFAPAHRYTPGSEEEILELLDRHSSGRIRVAGSRHSWSDAVASSDVLLDLWRLDKVEIATGPDGQVTVTTGGGCTIQRLLDVLHRKTNATLPTIGVIKKQTIAGAISTGTHGSGRPSLSHYAEEVWAAAYDPGFGKARVYHWDSGEGLRAARCSLGCMGVILAVKFRCVPKYDVEEAVVERSSLEEVIRDEDQYPLQQFVLLPYSWKYFAFQRRATPGAPGPGHALAVYWARASKFLAMDFSLHLLLRLMLTVASSKRGSSRFIGWFYQTVLPKIMGRKRRVVDSSEKAITMRHDLFQHLEMEVFVPSDKLPQAVSLVREIVSVFAGFSDRVAGEVAEQLDSIDRLEELIRWKGDYTHHYPIFFRRVLRDDTLISMTSGGQESYHSISFFTYLRPDSREHFYRFARFISQCLTRLFQARLHWGKYFPLSFAEIGPVYPQLEEFRRQCNQVDPRGVFQNDFTLGVLGFSGDRPSGEVRAVESAPSSAAASADIKNISDEADT